MSIGEVRRLLGKKTQQLAELRAQRKNLAGQVKQMDRQIGQLAGGRKVMRRGRVAKPARKVAKLAKRTAADGPSLKQLILQALAKAPGALTIADVIEAVTKAGYTSISGDFRGLVNAALVEMDEVGRVARGKYALKKSDSSAPGKGRAARPKTKKKTGKRKARKAKAKRAK